MHRFRLDLQNPNDFGDVDEGTTGITALIRREFRHLGCQVETEDRLITVRHSGRTALLYDTETSFTSATGKLLLKNKAWSRRALADAGLRIARGRSFTLDERDRACAYLRKLGRAVVKPVDGNMGRAVSVGVTCEDFDRAWDEAAAITRTGILVEEIYEDGIESRYLVIGGQCVGVMLRLPPSVTGDGERTVSELIAARNEQKRKIPGRRSKLITLDAHRESLLRQKGLSPSSVLAEGEHLEIDPKASISTGGDAYEVTELARADLKQVAERVASLFPGLDVIGVDILARDHFDPGNALDYIIIEANTRPGMSAHLFCDYGTPNNAYRCLAEHCLRQMGVEIPAIAAPPAVPARVAQPVPGPAQGEGSDQITLVFGGDTSLADSYIGRQPRPDIQARLAERPEEFFADLAPLIADRTHLVVNFESVLATSAQDPWDGKKKYLGHDDPARAVSVLKSIGVDSVSLANNHAMDFGPRHLLETIGHFENAGINTFGAGHNSRQSSFPLVLSSEIGNIYVFGGFEFRRAYHSDFGFYSSNKRPGVQGVPASPDGRLIREIRDFRKHDPAAFIIAFPHWGGGRNYTWANEPMMSMNTQFLKAGADLVLGHGAHMMQECWVEDSVATVFSLGNFVFNSPGRYRKAGVPPFSLVARLELRRPGDRWLTRLRLYPILSDNRTTDYRPRPVTAQEAATVHDILSRRGQRSFNHEFRMGQDHRGFYLERPSGWPGTATE